MLGTIFGHLIGPFQPFFIQCWEIATILGACQLDGIDWPHNDITSFGVSNNLECDQKCQSHPGCTLYAYSKGRNYCWLKSKKGDVYLNADILTGIKPANPVVVKGILVLIWLTSSNLFNIFTCKCSPTGNLIIQTSKEVPNNLCRWVKGSVKISAACEADGIDYPHNDIANFAVSGSAECSQRCQSEPRCALFAYSKGRKLCWLKTKKGAAAKDSDILTGFKTLGGNLLFLNSATNNKISKILLSPRHSHCFLPILLLYFTALKKESHFHRSLQGIIFWYLLAPVQPLLIQFKVNAPILGACQLDGIDWPNNDITSFAVSNNLECDQKCRGHPGCTLYAYSKGHNYCWLKSKKGDVVLNGDILTGIKPPIPVLNQGSFFKCLASLNFFNLLRASVLK